MATVPNTNTILKVAEISQYLYNKAIYSSRFYANQQIDKRRPSLISITKKDVEWLYNLSPSDATLGKTGEYLFGLCAPFTQQALTIIGNATAQPPIVTGPTNQSVNVGQNATFSVSVTSSLPVTYAWYRNGILQVGQTGPSFTISNAQLADSGNNVYARVTNAAGTTQSQTATLTVSAALVGYFRYSDTDPYPSIQSHIDNFTYQSTFLITNGGPFSIPIPSAASPLKFLLIKTPTGQPIKNKWSNTPSNFGDIPDSVWEAVESFGGFDYYCSRGTVTMDPASNLTLYVG